jgi:predicted DNA-binding protein
MTTAKQPMIELDPQLYEALRARAEETQRTVSDLVDEAVRLALAEDAEDLAALAERREEPDLSFDEVFGTCDGVARYELRVKPEPGSSES